jgi:hypothetical protein
MEAFKLLQKSILILGKGLTMDGMLYSLMMEEE